ncbi:bifunctional phosphopantothenoylcysteine decarboxylase/phosphopantothenate--cysteine ligase CoaBC [Lacticaseibacillus baoqingensis]|uniref:Coenzyme A biosynthesis bifunctional protein CoaBC n=1 Tax=Lacticaseibacillus baoqingensis TaxID=2486013 RepID=A0ABW4E356_9LACO|nr:bifunctional phosphopantothenoylcysteine decarboxylase/phosphopantothenate--cysteine ligase CoaBC [Lacticaseibacillus baoqingensis]
MTSQNIGIFVTGGIAAYKVPLLVRALVRAGHAVRVAMTPAAQAFVTEGTLATVSKHAVLTEHNEFAQPEHVAHVALAHWMDMAVVVPATANTIAKLAAGIADNAVTTTLLAFNGPKLLVPAMNDQMWLNAQTQANVAHLTAQGVAVLPPAVGFLAEGYQAVGRMPEVDVIEVFIDSYQPKPFLQGKHLVITAGGTRERLDPVRYISNDSSGKMGTALANIAAAAGAAVTLVTTAKRPVLPNIQVQQVQSAVEMQAAVDHQFADCDAVIMAAAVSDYRPKTVSDHKLKKPNATAGLTLELEQNPDILAGLGRQKTTQLVVGFAAETDDVLVNAAKKLQTKHADLLIANRVGQGIGFDQETNAVWLMRPNQAPEAIAEAPKTVIAAKILQMLATMMG